MAVLIGKFGDIVSPGRAVDVATMLDSDVGLFEVAADDMAGTADNALGGSNRLYTNSKFEHRAHAGSKERSSFGGRITGLKGGPTMLCVTFPL